MSDTDKLPRGGNIPFVEALLNQSPRHVRHVFCIILVEALAKFPRFATGIDEYLVSELTSPDNSAIFGELVDKRWSVASMLSVRRILTYLTYLAPQRFDHGWLWLFESIPGATEDVEISNGVVLKVPRFQASSRDKLKSPIKVIYPDRTLLLANGTEARAAIKIAQDKGWLGRVTVAYPETSRTKAKVVGAASIRSEQAKATEPVSNTFLARQQLEMVTKIAGLEYEVDKLKKEVRALKSSRPVQPNRPVVSAASRRARDVKVLGHPKPGFFSMPAKKRSELA